jgi:hypothetical protein
MLRRMLETQSDGEFLVVDGSGYLGSASHRRRYRAARKQKRLVGCRHTWCDQRCARIGQVGFWREGARDPTQRRAPRKEQDMSVQLSRLAASLLHVAAGFTETTTEFLYRVRSSRES